MAVNSIAASAMTIPISAEIKPKMRCFICRAAIPNRPPRRLGRAQVRPDYTGEAASDKVSGGGLFARGGLGAGHRALGVLVARRARDSDGADDLAVHDDRHAAFE